ncbi:deoxyguanosinetriphosphate triphosphohydrolase [Coralliovum pocilloporae]|uniref:deoxyguanosinetriphosphate triphosphohydrolase n=1 Tax=Coralliovum pocilloporae TaxID=3066369 RepID=UPI003306A386
MEVNQPGAHLIVKPLGYGAQPRADYASLPDESRGRLFPESESRTRTPFQRDRDRIIHSTAFRRLKHKTQVFVYHEGDHFRTRLTHTIEVAQIARSVARALRLDEDLAEALALAHDLGHTPFGHTGEDALDECMEPYEGFDHNAQSLRVVTRLERRYAEFDGLNLSWETLEGLVKHNGPLVDASGKPLGKRAGPQLAFGFRDYPDLDALELTTFASAEAQAAAIADDIAYNAHDIDDGLRAGLFTLNDLKEVDLLRDMIGDIDRAYPGLDSHRFIHELVRRIITALVEDVIGTAIRRIGSLQPATSNDIRQCGFMLVGFSDAMAAHDKAIKGFLFPRMYRHEDVMVVRRQVDQVVRDLFDLYMKHPDRMPEEWFSGASGMDETLLARRVCDFIAGMTDRYALQLHRQWFDASPDLG